MRKLAWYGGPGRLLIVFQILASEIDTPLCISPKVPDASERNAELGNPAVVIAFNR